MKYTTEVTINLPRERVAELFQSPEFSKRWQPTLHSLETVSGEHAQTGSVSHLHYVDGKREMTMKETILSNNLPEEFTAVYEVPNVYNLNINRFYPVGEGQTRWESVNEFRFKGFMRIVAFFMRGAFTSRTQQDMEVFKAEAESMG